MVGRQADTEHCTSHAGEDISYKELRKAFKLLRDGNTEMIELLFNDAWEEIWPQWRLIQSFRHKLVDTDKLYKCLSGYIEGEAKLTLGERTGKLGGKRFESLQKYGYSPKNLVQLVRLSWAGRKYFQEGRFPVNIHREDKNLAADLFRVKTEPQKYNKQFAKDVIQWQKELLEDSYNNRKV